MMKDTLLRIKYHIMSGLAIKAGKLHIVIDYVLCLSAPFLLWMVAVVYVPIMGAGLDTARAWLASLAILALMVVSLFLHSLSHLLVTKIFDRAAPLRIVMAPTADPAQSSHPLPTPGKEALATLAGPIVQLILAALFYVIWNLQPGDFINVIAFFMIFFNLGIAAFNLIPAFPFDGGRLVRAVFWRVAGRPGLATKAAWRAGWAVAAGFTAWSIYLLAQTARFSLETAGISFGVAVLIALSLAIHQGWQWDKPENPAPSSRPGKALKWAIAVILLLPLVFITICLAPMNEGIEAPGFTASVEPMVQMPEAYRHEAAGSLIMVSVIPQAPILAGEWIYAHIDKSIRITPPEDIVPENETAQKVAAENYDMLQDSETQAIIVGLRLAGYSVELHYDGVSIMSILETSPAITILEPDDIITGINSLPVLSTTDLTDELQSLPAGSIIEITVQRGGQTLELTVPTMPASEEITSARIGISILQHSGGFTLPFPVEIREEKVTGGPSAGLMFTLGVYDLLTEGDLTGGLIIAGTGTIDLEGNVGPIGGVQQKVVAAERAGAAYFLSPAENYEDAAATAKNIQVIKVTTAQEAIDFLKSMSQNIDD
jgi:PDZ domain-containing protein